MEKDIKQLVTQHEMRFKDLRREIDTINCRLNEFFRQIENICQKPDVPAEFRVFRSYVESHLACLTNLNKTHSSISIDLSAAKDSITKEVKALKDEAILAEIQLGSLLRSMEGHKEEMSCNHKKQEDFMSRTFSSYREEIKKMVGSEVGKFSASPASILATNEGISKKLDEALSGLTNTIETSRNQSSFIAVLERKISALEDRLKRAGVGD